MTNKLGATAFHLAKISGRAKIEKWLIKQGANPNILPSLDLSFIAL